MPMPADANGNGDIFGGWIMAQVDLAGAVLPARIAKGRIATVAVNQFVFKQPVSVGDLLCFYAQVERVGSTSVTVHVEVYAERNPADLQVVKVTEANLTYVAIDTRASRGRSRSSERRNSPTLRPARTIQHGSRASAEVRCRARAQARRLLARKRRRVARACAGSTSKRAATLGSQHWIGWCIRSPVITASSPCEADAHADVARRVPGRGLEPHLARSARGRSSTQSARPASITGRHRIGHHLRWSPSPALDQCSYSTRAEQIARVREGRQPAGR